MNESQDKILSKIKSLLYEYDLETGKDNVRLELQYPETVSYTHLIPATSGRIQKGKEIIV